MNIVEKVDIFEIQSYLGCETLLFAQSVLKVNTVL